MTILVKFETDAKEVAYKSYDIFIGSIQFVKVIKVFKRSIVRYINKPQYTAINTAKSSLALIARLTLFVVSLEI